MSVNLAVPQKLRFGMEELLGVNARSLFENLFSTRHLGRVLDFFLFESRAFVDGSSDPVGIEYRVRQILELGVSMPGPTIVRAIRPNVSKWNTVGTITN